MVLLRLLCDTCCLLQDGRNVYSISRLGLVRVTRYSTHTVGGENKQPTIRTVYFTGGNRFEVGLALCNDSEGDFYPRYLPKTEQP